MVKDAEANADVDKKRRALAEVRNQAEALIHQTEKAIADLGADAPSDQKAAAEKAIADTRTAIAGEDPSEIEAKANALQEVAMKLGEHAYRKAQENSAGAADNAASPDASSSPANNDDIVDADVLELDEEDDKKKNA